MTDITTSDAKPQPEYKEQMQALLREAGPRLFTRYYEQLQEDNVKVDDLRKAVELIINATDAALEKKVDANANLPVFNITFDMGTGLMQATQVVEEVKPEVVEELPPPEVEPALTLEPLPAEDLLSALNNLMAD